MFRVFLLLGSDGDPKQAPPKKQRSAKEATVCEELARGRHPEAAVTPRSKQMQTTGAHPTPLKNPVKDL